MKNDEWQKKYLLILFVAAVVFSVAAFLLPLNKGGLFWIAYIFEIVAILLQIPVFKLAFNTETLRSKFLGFPVFRVGYLYLAIQTITSIVLFALSKNDFCPVWAGTLICVIILGAALVCSLSADIARITAEKIETKQNHDTSYFDKLKTMSAGLTALTEDADMTKALTKLAEDFKYSDPVSSSATIEADTELIDMLQTLSLKLKDGTASIQDVQGIANKLVQRNAVNKANKR